MFKKLSWFLIIGGLATTGIICGFDSTPVSAVTYSASLSTSGVLSVDATSNGNGTSVGVDTLTVNSTCPAGYNITIEGPSDTNLYLNGNSSNNASGSYIAHSTGTPSNPVSITGANLGTWGYSTSSSTGSGTFIGLTNTAATLYSKNSASASGGDSIPVYYGVSIPATLTPGTYKMPGTSAITYYLTRNDNCVSYLVSFNANGGSGTAMATQRIYEGQATALSTNTYTAPTGKVFKEWNTAADGSGTSYDDEEVVTDIASAGTTLPLYAIWEDSYCRDNPNDLYCRVASMSKGTQSASDLKAIITVPTSSNPSLDTSNSGVYQYNSSVFGGDSDASRSNNTKATIYYYRGILDSNLDNTSSSSYGSNGNGAYYPNYVRLGDTCWRIIRTTGSGGVKMIYNGLYSGGTTSNSCANALTDAQITNNAYNGTDSYGYRQIVRVGYTHNSTYAVNTSQTAPISTLFGSDSNYSVNNADSNIKDYIENTWFDSSNGINAYKSILEPSAGYCNDRTVFNTNNVRQQESTNVQAYGTSQNITTYRFGPYVRKSNGITLSCSRSTVDLYTTSSASDGNKQLKYPVSLLTSDEAALSGSGYNGRTSTATYASNYSYSSFLRSGSAFWLLSPYDRGGYGVTSESLLLTGGNIDYNGVHNSHGVRPVISLKEGVAPSSGSGTANDPWVVEKPPKVLYDEVAKMSKGTQTASELQTTITTSNSGVYEYDSTTFGASSDASNDKKIYYYRGILDSDGNTGTYGSGPADAYPNYVKLGTTCWRIVRTTGSGGVKMIYSGIYGSTTAGSCANTYSDAQVTSMAFGIQGNSSQSENWHRVVNKVGYTFNNTSSIQNSTTRTSVDTVFGSNSNYNTTNTTDSNVKDYLENTWFTSANGISAFESILEPSAGYCNDRSAFSNTSGSNALSTIAPYATTGATMYFGSYIRFNNTPSLTCPETRNIVDLYTTSSATDGNKQLTKPVALLTIDEMSLAGSGNRQDMENNHAYLFTGSFFLSISPAQRETGGYTSSYGYSQYGDLRGAYVNSTTGVRPVVSLKANTAISSGTGTATDPWIIAAP